uniref:Uncharacterized protein n=1 Tax=Denticeps clupeoides TaxID=299321 RepID=A0AAY4D356_9TELE
MDGKQTKNEDKNNITADTVSSLLVNSNYKANHKKKQVLGSGTDAARARWTILRQVLRQKQLDSVAAQPVSVRRFSSFSLFSRTRVVSSHQDVPSEVQWAEYRSAFFPQYSALLRDNLGPIRMDEVLQSFDNTGNVYTESSAQTTGRPQ